MDTESIKSTFYKDLCRIEEVAKLNQEIKIGQILEILQEKGYAALFILFSLPFCLPIQIPGFSTPFGFIIGFAGFRMFLGLQPWWPEWVQKRSLSSKNVELIVSKTKSLVKKIEHIHKRRWSFLSTNPAIYRFNGLVIILLSFFLALPLPLPFTNLVCGVPILLMGLGMLEDDGLAILLSYVFTVVCIIFFIALAFFGKTLFTKMNGS